MAKNVVVKMRKINRVADNLSYLADTEEHPDICYIYGTCTDPEVWKEYAKVNREEFKASGAATKGRRCVEAREAIYILPEEYYILPNEEKERICREAVDTFAKTHGVDVYAAMHGSDKDCKNLHIHIMYMERTRETRGAKIATRRLYFDDRGRQVKSKHLATDEAGNLLPGYSYVKTGETYGGSREWSAKNQYLHSNQFTRATKIWWANWLNQQREKAQELELQASEERTVYDRDTSPYLPLQDEFKPLRYSDAKKAAESREKAKELSEDIIKCNELRKSYNENVDAAIDIGVSEYVLLEKRKEVTEDIVQAIKDNQQHNIKSLIQDAIAWIQRVIGRLKEQKKAQEAQESRPMSLEDKIKAARNKTPQKPPGEHVRAFLDNQR